MNDEWKSYKNLQTLLQQAQLGLEAGRAAIDMRNPAIQALVRQAYQSANIGEKIIQTQFPSVRDKVLASFGPTYSGISGIRMLQEDRFLRQAILGSLAEDLKTWEKLTHSHNAALRQVESARINEAAALWSGSIHQLGRRLEAVNFVSQHRHLTARLLAPTQTYTTFVEKTEQRIEETQDPKVTKALEISLELAEEQFLTTTDALIEIIEAPETEDDTSPARSLELPFTQQHELIALAQTDDKQDQTLIQQSTIAQIADQARLVLDLVLQCNRLVSVASQSPIFKPTQRIMEVFADFPWLVAQNQTTFAQVVDCLYLMLYEGAGKDCLRYHQDCGGVLTKADCQFVWIVKHLRNKWLRHDIEHGKDTEIKKSWKALLEALKQLGLNRAPCSKEEFIHLHHQTLQGAISFLTTLRDRIIASDAASN